MCVNYAILKGFRSGFDSGLFRMEYGTCRKSVCNLVPHSDQCQALYMDYVHCLVCLFSFSQIAYGISCIHCCIKTLCSWLFVFYLYSVYFFLVASIIISLPELQDQHQALTLIESGPPAPQSSRGLNPNHGHDPAACHPRKNGTPLLPSQVILFLHPCHPQLRRGSL